MFNELNGVLAFNFKMCDAGSEVTVLNERSIPGAYRYAGNSAWHCANRVFGTYCVNRMLVIIHMDCS